MGNCSVIGEYKLYIIFDEIEDIIQKESNYNVNEITKKISSFLLSEDFTVLMIERIRPEKNLYLITANILSIDKILFFKILFPLLEQLQKSKFEKQMKFIFNCFKKNDKEIKKYVEDYLMRNQEFLNNCQNMKKYSEKLNKYLESPLNKLYTNILLKSFYFLFAKEEFKELIREKDKEKENKEIIILEIKEKNKNIDNELLKEMKIVLNYLINLEVFNNFEYENIKQYIIMLYQILIHPKIDIYFPSDPFYLFFSENNLKENYLYFFFDPDNKFTNAISYKKKIENKNPSINFFKLKNQNDANTKINIYQSLFNDEEIILLDYISENIKKEINQIKNKNENINIYIPIENKIIAIQEFKDLNLKDFIRSKIKTLIKVTRTHKIKAEQIFIMEIIKKWSSLKPKLREKLELIYKNLEDSYLKMINEISKIKEQENIYKNLNDSYIKMADEISKIRNKENMKKNLNGSYSQMKKEISKIQEKENTYKDLHTSYLQTIEKLLNIQNKEIKINSEKKQFKIDNKENIIIKGTNQNDKNFNKLNEGLKNEKLNNNNNLIKEIIELKKELNNVINKNKILEEKVNMLQIELLFPHGSSTFKVNKEKLKYTDLEEKIKAKEILKKNLIKNSKENLYEIIFEKDNEIEELKIKIKQYPVELKEGE